MPAETSVMKDDGNCNVRYGQVTKELWETVHKIDNVIQDYNAGLMSHEELVFQLSDVCDEYKEAVNVLR